MFSAEVELPTFSTSQQPFMTQIALYLLELPQQLEGSENAKLLSNLQNVESILFRAPVRTHPPHLITHTTLKEKEQSAEQKNFVVLWLSALARGTTSLFYDTIMRIPKLTDLGTKQLATDIEYLGNALNQVGIVLDERLTTIMHICNAPSASRSELLKRVDPTIGEPFSHKF